MTDRFADRLRARSAWRHGPLEPEPEPEPAVGAYRRWTEQLMAGTDRAPTPRTLDLRKLRLTEGFREAMRQAPREQDALFGIWDAAYRTLERLYWELAPPVIDPPPPPTFEETRRQYKALKKERERQEEAAATHWHPLELDRVALVTTESD
jgi:hypothetical protein